MEQPTGGLGFFESVGRRRRWQPCSLDAGEDLAEGAEGMEAVDGPINFGEKDKYWGLLVDNFDGHSELWHELQPPRITERVFEDPRLPGVLRATRVWPQMCSLEVQAPV